MRWDLGSYIFIKVFKGFRWVVWFGKYCFGDKYYFLEEENEVMEVVYYRCIRWVMVRK